MRKTNFLFKGAVLTALFIFQSAMAQSLGLQGAGQNILNEVAGAFPYVAAVLFIFAGWKALNEYSETKDVMASLKIVLWYIIAILVIVGAYGYIKNVKL